MYKYAPETYDCKKEFNEVEQFYWTRYREDVATNVALVKYDTLDNNKDQMQTKIKNFANKFGYTIDEVKAHILEDDMFAAQFAKDPTKQSCYQNYALEYIKSNYGWINIQSLPNSGNKSKYIYDGKIVFKSELPKGFTGTTKSIDFEATASVNGQTINLYFSHKHTTKNGGGQDNQWSDLAAFMDCAKVVNNKMDYFIALADGDYYNNIMPVEQITRMEFLRKYHGTEHVLAMNTAELKQFLESLCSM